MALTMGWHLSNKSRCCTSSLLRKQGNQEQSRLLLEAPCTFPTSTGQPR